MPAFNRFLVAWKAVNQLGLRPVILTAIYQAGVKSGIYRLLTPPRKEDIIFRIPPDTPDIIRTFSKHGWGHPSRQYLLSSFPSALEKVIAEADELLAGKIRLFGGSPVDLIFSPNPTLRHWSQVTVHEKSGEDIKFGWETARFGWAFTLGRAYTFTGNEKYADAFWKLTESFLENNPVNLGSNWVSGQEIALRLIAYVFGLQVFQYSPHSTLARQARLINSVRQHARRIIPTLIYAEGQNNNHLVSEAAGLYTAGVFLSGHKDAEGWRKKGFQLFCSAVSRQVQPDGTYIQHSTNYHRHFLLLAVWFNHICEKNNESLPEQVRQRLTAATIWLISHIDPLTGSCSNLGHNDGSNIFPLTACDYGDFRPVAQAASTMFTGKPAFQQGDWDELSIWLGLAVSQPGFAPVHSRTNSTELFLGNPDCWGSLRAAKYNDRPAHSDQLHIDLWWKGHNIAMDPGTFRYTAPEPWNNSLASTAVHNTVMVNSKNQMLKAGRFLWLDWAQARRCPEFENENTLAAEHDGYRNLGIIHRRLLHFFHPNRWIVKDHLFMEPNCSSSVEVTLNWLLPDGKWRIEGNTLHMMYSLGEIRLSVVAEVEKVPGIYEMGLGRQFDKMATRIIDPEIRLVREGKAHHGNPRPGDDILGWYSPTYSAIRPAVSLQAHIRTSTNCIMTSTWILSD